MNRTEVTKDGQSPGRPGRDAVTGAAWSLPDMNGNDGPRPRRREGGGSRKGRPEFESYYGKPIINPPVWEAREIAGYFFLGGLAGAGSVVAAGAQATGRTQLATGMKVGSAAAAGLSLVALVKDLGVPTRFYNMLRVLRPTSPMSVGSWLLGAYVPAAAVAAGSAVTGRVSRTGAVATGAAALIGPFIASYTGALVADTAVPAWHGAHRELPIVFAASGASAAAGLGMVVASVDTAGPARRLGLFATAVEIAAERAMERSTGTTGEVYRQGRAGRLLRGARILGIGGALTGAVLARRSRTAGVVAGGAMMTASALTRFGVFDAGMASARAPRDTVMPQRERADDRATAATALP